MMTDSRQHALFDAYPLDGSATISAGTVPTPYHVYDGSGMFLGGSGALEQVKRLLEPENLVPVATTDGRALMGVWICDFTDASLGPHHELQISLFVTRKQTTAVATHPLNVLEVMLARPDVLMMCHGLWNNTPVVVAYNRELLSLNARLAASTIQRDGTALRFAFDDADTGASILAGAIEIPRRSAWQTGLGLVSRIGFRRMFALGREPWVKMQVVNPVGVKLTANAVAQSFTKNAVDAVQYYDAQRARVVFGNSPYQGLQFMPQFVQYMDGFKFVYLMPQ